MDQRKRRIAKDTELAFSNSPLSFSMKMMMDEGYGWSAVQLE
jgi:hypothetical protein